MKDEVLEKHLVDCGLEKFTGKFDKLQLDMQLIIDLSER